MSDRTIISADAVVAATKTARSLGFAISQEMVGQIVAAAFSAQFDNESDVVGLRLNRLEENSARMAKNLTQVILYINNSVVPLVASAKGQENPE